MRICGRQREHRRPKESPKPTRPACWTWMLHPLKGHIGHLSLSFCKCCKNLRPTEAIYPRVSPRMMLESRSAWASIPGSCTNHGVYPRKPLGICPSGILLGNQARSRDGRVSSCHICWEKLSETGAEKSRVSEMDRKRHHLQSELEALMQMPGPK